MRLRTDGILRTKFREIILTDGKGHVKGIFWARTPEQARRFAKLMRSLQFRVRIRRATGDQHINYIILHWLEAESGIYIGA